MVKKEIIADRLEKLREYLKILRAIQKYEIERFKKDPFIHGAAERYLHLSIECLLDIGNHIIADRGCRKPDTYAEILGILVEEQIIPQGLGRRMAGMAAFRNVLVHDYLKLDLDRVYKIVKGQVKNFEALARIYSDFL